ncbi:hypothetical protein JCM1841_005565 [Sporobolomyces salmonicolor]
MPSFSPLDLSFSSSSPDPNGTAQPHSQHRDYSTGSLTRHREQPHEMSRSFSGPAPAPVSPRSSFPFQPLLDHDQGYAFALSPPRTPPSTASHLSLASSPQPFPLPPSPPPEALARDPVRSLQGPLTPFFMPSFAHSNGSTRGGERKLSRIASAPAPLGSISESSNGTIWSPREGGVDEAENGCRGSMGVLGEGAVQDVGVGIKTEGGGPLVKNNRQMMTFSKADDLSRLSVSSLSLDTRVRTLADTVNILQTNVCGLEEHTLQRDREYEDLRAFVACPQQQQQHSPAYPFPSPLPDQSYIAVPFESDPADLKPPATVALPFNPHAQPFTVSTPASSNHSQSRVPSFPSTSTRPHNQSMCQVYAPPSLEQQFAFSKPFKRGLAGSPSPSAGQGSSPPVFTHRDGTAMLSSAPQRPAFVPPQPPHRQRHHPSIAERALRTALGESFVNGAATLVGGNVSGPVTDRKASRRTKSVTTVGGSGGGDAGGWRQPAQHVSRLHSASLGLLSPSRRTGVGGTASSRGNGHEQINYRVLLETDSIIDNVVFVRRIFVQNDQQCSLFLQQRVRTTTPENRKKLCEAVEEFLLELSFSKFGNFLVSRCLDAGDLKLAQSYSTIAVGHFLDLSLDPFGCHVVQKLIDCGDNATKEQVIAELMPHPTTLTQKNAAHVWNRLLTTPNPPVFYHRLAAMGEGTWADVVKDDGGSLIVQHVLEGSPEAYGGAIAKEVLEGLEGVARTACGSFVLAQCLERNALPFRAKVMDLAPRLSIDNFGAKIVEKCVKMGRIAPPVVADFVEAITSREGDSHAPLLLAIASHATGAQLLSHLLSSTLVSPPAKALLTRCIGADRSKLLAGGGTGAAKLVRMVEKATNH